ncbi:hypothetical protein [Paraburkholderia piptadeniae]|nr:hypothetical protein [Paraburkholderia piptadeniae]
MELKAEVDQTFKQALDGLSCVMAVEVIGSEISIFRRRRAACGTQP